MYWKHLVTFLYQAKLAEIVDRRRQEEDELLQQEMKANARRKKFKEVNLLIAFTNVDRHEVDKCLPPSFLQGAVGEGDEISSNFNGWK